MGKIKITYSTLSTMKSIITDDLEHCIECGYRAEDCHHVYEGPDKRWSEHFKLMVPMCHMCHMELHNNQHMNDFYKRLGQEAFEREYPDVTFTVFFRRNYL